MYKEGYGNIANKDKVMYYLEKAYEKTPGKWIAKAWRMGQMAEKMAEDLDLDPDIAFACGALARLSDAYGKDLFGSLKAYEILRADSYFFPARIAITRAFPLKTTEDVKGDAKDLEFVEKFLYKYDYNDYDYLIQYLDFLVGEEDLGLDKDFSLKDEANPRLWERVEELDEYFRNKLKEPIDTYMPRTKRYKFPYKLFPKDR